MELGKIFAGLNSLVVISELDINGATSFKISKLMLEINTELEVFKETQNELIKKYGGEPKEDGSISVLEENLEKYHAEVKVMMEIESDIVIPQISINEFLDVKVKPKTFTPLIGWLIKE